jgi:hypothetical protein
MGCGVLQGATPGGAAVTDAEGEGQGGRCAYRPARIPALHGSAARVAEPGTPSMGPA